MEDGRTANKRGHASWSARGTRLGWLAVGPALGAVALGFAVVWSVSGWGYTLGLVMIAISVVDKRASWLGLAVVLLVALVRLGGAGGSVGVLTTSGPPASSRVVSRLVAERDGVMLAALLLVQSGRLPNDARAFRPALRDAYDRMDDAIGAFATPAVATYLGLQTPEAFDLVAFGPDDADDAVVFLHGYAGNFAIYCWQFSRAVPQMRVVCPSRDAAARWWREPGERVVQRTLEHLGPRRHVLLAGLSNGSFGASRLITRFEPGTFAGLVLISGVAGDARDPQVPTLVIHSARDSMTSPRAARVYAHRTGATLVMRDARDRPNGHFMFLDDHEAVRVAIATWVGQKLARGTPAP